MKTLNSARVLFLLVPALLTAGLAFLDHDTAAGHGAVGFAGPGAVLDAATGILRAIEQRDAAYLGRAFAVMGQGDGIEVAYDADGRQKESDLPEGLVCHEVDVDGKVVRAATVAEAAARLAVLAGKDVVLEHRVVAARVDCPSPHCSWGTVEFERTIRRGDATTVMPMRVTLLTRYQNDVPHMRAMLWHCSAAR